MSAEVAALPVEATKPEVPAGDEHKYIFNVAMSCGGCSGAVSRVLGKLNGVKTHNEDLKTQLVTVTTVPELDYEKVLSVIKKTGKKVKKAEADGKEMSVEVKAVEAAA